MADLILNADDFGRSQQINRAVIQAHRQGVLTSASLMVAGEASDDAVELARQNPRLQIGLHVVVVDGSAVLPQARIPHLVDACGRFANQPIRLGMKYAFSSTARLELAAEIEAQFERFARTGLPLNHVDGHQHMHLHPAVFDRVAALARQYGAKRIRIVRDHLPLALRYSTARAPAKIVACAVFAALARRCRKRARKSGLDWPGRTYGLFQSGAMDEAYLRAVLRQACDGDEIYFHPTQGARLDPLGPNPGDLAALLSPALSLTLAAQSPRGVAVAT